MKYISEEDVMTPVPESVSSQKDRVKYLQKNYYDDVDWQVRRWEYEQQRREEIMQDRLLDRNYY